MGTDAFISGLAEVALAVRDVLASARFYADVIGLSPETPPTDRGASFLLGPPAQQQRLILLSRSLPPLDQRGEPASVVDTSVSAPTNLPSLTPAQLGRTHFALRVPRDCLDQLVDRVRHRGVQVSGPIRFGWMQATAYYVLDPDGHAVEFWSADPEQRPNEVALPNSASRRS